MEHNISVGVQYQPNLVVSQFNAAPAETRPDAIGGAPAGLKPGALRHHITPEIGLQINGWAPATRARHAAGGWHGFVLTRWQMADKSILIVNVHGPQVVTDRSDLSSSSRGPDTRDRGSGMNRMSNGFEFSHLLIFSEGACQHGTTIRNSVRVNSVPCGEGFGGRVTFSEFTRWEVDRYL